MRIAVTGLGGFTGKHLGEELSSQGYQVLGLRADLTDSKKLSAELASIQPQAVVHLAGVAFVAHGDVNAFYQVNLIGTRNLLEALARHVPSVRAILLASSANVYGNRSEGRLDESAPPDPANDYAVSKLAMEHMAKLWMNRLPLFIVRPFNYTGVGQGNNFLIPKIVSHFREQKKSIELGNLDISRDFGDVRSVVEAYRKLIEVCPTGEIINVCTGRSLSLKKIVTLCQEMTGHEINVRVNQAFVRENDVRMLAGDNRHLTRLIGTWKPRPFEETLRWMLQSGISS